MKTVVYCGVEYRQNRQGYLVCTTRHRGNNCHLHRHVWEDFNGPIPPGHNIHHINGDKADNRVGNLQIMSQEAHTSHHYAIHLEQAEVECAVCGKKFKPGNPWTALYCSIRCKNKQYLKTRREDRVCVVCGAVFTTYKYSKAKHCSSRCVRDNSDVPLAQRKTWANKEKTDRPCVVCGKAFAAKTKRAKYCSSKCSGAYWTAARRRKVSPGENFQQVARLDFLGKDL